MTAGPGRGPDGSRRDRATDRPDDGSREQLAVPRARFRSYYGRPVLKPPVWEWKIPAYFFTGGLSAGSALLAAGADLTGRPALRRAGRLGGFAALLASMYLLIADLGRPERFHHMLRVAKPSSPMSVGTWILVAYGPGSAVAAAAELLPERLRSTLAGRVLRAAARPAGLSAAAFAPGVAAYTAALLAQTAVPAWHEARRELPFVYTGSAAASGAGLGLMCAPVAEAGPPASTRPVPQRAGNPVSERNPQESHKRHTCPTGSATPWSPRHRRTSSESAFGTGMPVPVTTCP